MSRQLRCPNCGGEHELVNPGITMLVCEFCKTTVYWDADSVLKMGSQSILPAKDTRLFMHATGKLSERGFEVVGHLRYDHGRGTWDEWYLQLDNDQVAWLSEDERELSLERAARLDAPIPPATGLRPGHPVTLEGTRYTVREVGNATCLGGEGQLPFTLLPGERYAYADLADQGGDRFASLEYDGETPRAFTGEVLGHQQLTLDDEPPPSTAGSKEGKHVKCPNCDAPLELAGDREVQTITCAYCGAQNDLTGAEARVAGINPAGLDPGFGFEIGEGGEFRGARYEICGRMLYQDQEGYTTREYLLFNPSAGYLWLAEENGHYVLNRPTQQAPSINPFGLPAKRAVTAGPSTFRFYESGTVRLVYVDGALPWQAATGDTAHYADLIAPPSMLSVETDGKETEHFIGTYLPAPEVWSAFGRQETPPRPLGVHPAQPFQRGPLARALMVVGGIFALVNLGLLGWSVTSKGRPIFEKTFQSSEYIGECSSEPFAVGPESVLALTINAPIHNSWLALEAALVNSEKQVVEEMDGDISYYAGVEGGESWSEGNRRTTTYFRAPPPGTYQLILRASGGSGMSGPCLGEPLTVHLHQGAILSRYFLAAFILALLFPLFEVTRKHLFEKRRWAPVTEDDDDDD